MKLKMNLEQEYEMTKEIVVFFIFFMIPVIIGFVIYPYVLNENTKNFCLDLTDLNYNAYMKRSNIFLFETCYIDDTEITYEDYKQIKLINLNKKLLE